MSEIFKRILTDTLGLGLGLWISGFAFGTVLFPFVTVAIIWKYFVSAAVPLMMYATYRRLAGLNETNSYYLTVGLSWAAVAIFMDYVLLVKAFVN